MPGAPWVPLSLGEGLFLWLHPSGAAYLPDHATLLVADVHLGKAASFRRLGVPVPAGSTQTILDDLTRVLHEAHAQAPVRRLVFLGDLLHSARGRTASMAAAVTAQLAAWRHHVPHLECVLVRGNHDHAAGDPPAEWGLALQDAPWRLGAFALSHEPQATPGAYTLGGHLHPCIGLRGAARQRLRLPCFWFGDPAHNAVGVLPAFGDFTGMHPIRPRAGDRVWAVADEAVREVRVDWR